MIKQLCKPIAPLAAAILLVSGGVNASGQASSDLSLVPASSPYVFYNEKSSPEDLTKRWIEYSADSLHGAIADLERLNQGKDKDVVTTTLLAIFKEFENDFSLDGLRKWGFKPGGHVLVYGLGPLPVARLEISDATKMRAFIARIETHLKQPMEEKKFGDQAYWRIGDAKAGVIIAVTPTHLVATILPAKLEQEYLDDVLTPQPLKDSIASSGKWDELIKTHGYTGYGEGYIDLHRLASQAAGRDATDQNAALWKTLTKESKKKPSPGCVDVGLALLENTPRFVFGTEELTSNSLVFAGLLETKPEIAKRLQALAAPVPGLGAESKVMFSFGVGMNQPALRDGIKFGIQTILDTNQGKCEEIKPERLQASLKEVDKAFNPMFSGIKGFYLEIDDVTLQQGGPLPIALDGQVLISANNVRNLYAMTGMFAPPLAQLTIPEDGSPVALPLAQMAPGVPPVYIAIKDNSLLGLSTGPHAEGDMGPFLDAKPGAKSPILAINYDLVRMAASANKVFTLLKPTLDPKVAEVVQQQIKSIETQSKLFGSIGFSMTGTDKGLEFRETVQLR